MKIWKLYFFWEGKQDNIIRFGRKISRLDLERIDKYLNGGYHIHKDPGKRPKKPLFNLPPPKEEEKEDESHAALPRHTPEELDRFIEAVREVESP